MSVLSFLLTFFLVVIIDLLHAHHLHPRLGALRRQDDVLGGVGQPQPHLLPFTINVLGHTWPKIKVTHR